MSFCKTGLTKRVCNVVLALMYATTQVVWAYQPETGFWETRHQKGVSHKDPLTPLIQILSRHTTIEQIHRSKHTPAPTFVLIQDIHGNPQAQENISQTLVHVLKQYPTTKIGLEGASGLIDVAPFRGPDLHLNQRIGDILFNKELISGPEAVAFQSETAPHLVGLENPALYLKHVEILKQALSRQKIKEKEATSQKRALQNKVGGASMRNIQPLYEKKEAFQKKSISLAAYLQFLQTKNKKTPVPASVEDFLFLLNSEEELDWPALKQQIKQGQGSRPPPPLKPLLDYVERRSNFNPQQFLTDLKTFEKSVWLEVCQNRKQRKWVQELWNLESQEKLITLSLTSQEWSNLKDKEPNSFIDFYSVAQKRDGVLAKNFLTTMAHEKRGVLVVGGFHTDGILKKLKKRNAHIIVVTPYLDASHLKPVSNYYQKFLDPHTQSLVQTRALKPIGLHNQYKRAQLLHLIKKLNQKLKKRGFEIGAIALFTFFLSALPQDSVWILAAAPFSLPISFKSPRKTKEYQFVHDQWERLVLFDPDKATLLKAHYVDGKTLKEISHDRGVTSINVEYLLIRAFLELMRTVNNDRNYFQKLVDRNEGKLSLLKEDYEKILSLHFIDGKRIREIEVELGMDHKEVYNKLSRALKELIHIVEFGHVPDGVIFENYEELLPQLPNNKKRVLIDKFRKGLTRREIVEKEGITGASVTERIQTGIKRLKELGEKNDQINESFVEKYKPALFADAPYALKILIYRFSGKYSVREIARMEKKTVPEIQDIIIKALKPFKTRKPFSALVSSGVVKSILIGMVIFFLHACSLLHTADDLIPSQKDPQATMEKSEDFPGSVQEPVDPTQKTGLEADVLEAGRRVLQTLEANPRFEYQDFIIGLEEIFLEGHFELVSRDTYEKHLSHLTTKDYPPFQFDKYHFLGTSSEEKEFILVRELARQLLARKFMSMLDQDQPDIKKYLMALARAHYEATQFEMTYLTFISRNAGKSTEEYLNHLQNHTKSFFVSFHSYSLINRKPLDRKSHMLSTIQEVLMHNPALKQKVKKLAHDESINVESGAAFEAWIEGWLKAEDPVDRRLQGGLLESRVQVAGQVRKQT